MTYNGKESEKEYILHIYNWIYMHNWINCHTLETNTTVQINYTSIKCKKKKEAKIQEKKMVMLDHKGGWMLKNWCFWSVVLEKTLENPLDCRRSHQPVLRETSPEYSLEELMLKLKLQYFGHLMRRTDSLPKTLILGKIEGRRRRGQQRMRQLDGITDSVDMSFSEL